MYLFPKGGQFQDISIYPMGGGQTYTLKIWFQGFNSIILLASKKYKVYILKSIAYKNNSIW